jgi:hypothetical protein
MKTRYIALLYAWLLSGAFLFSQDCIIVVDATGSMKDPLGKEPRGIGKNKFDPRKPKHEHVQKALVKYLDNTPLAGQRVYIYFFNNGNDGEKEEGKEEFVFNVQEEKDKALKFAKDYGKFIGDKTHLWSSFHEALTFGEKNGYYKAADPKKGQPEIFPTVILLSDGLDIQTDGGWVLKKDETKKPAILDNHKWLCRQKAAQWLLVGVNKVEAAGLIKAWEGEDKGGEGCKGIGKVIPVDPNVDPTIGRVLFPPKIELRHAGDIIKANEPIPAGEKVTMIARGGYDKFTWDILDKNGKTILSQPPRQVIKREDATLVSEIEIPFNEGGTFTIRVTGTHDKKGVGEPQDAEATITVLSPLDIKPAFEVRYNNEVIEDGAVLWAGKKPLEFTLIDKTTVMQMQQQLLPAQLDGKLQFKWNVKVKNGANQNPAPVPLGVGKHRIDLTVNEVGKPANATSAILNFDIKQATLKVGIKEGNAPAAGKAMMIKEGDEVPFQLDFVGPAGTEIALDFGDGNTLRRTSPKEEKTPKHTYGTPRAEEYVVKATAILSGGVVIDASVLNPISVTKRNAVVDAFPTANPWPGEKVRLTPKADNVEKVTWMVDDVVISGDPKTGHLDHVFLNSGKPKVMASILFKGASSPRSVPVDITVKDVKPKVVVTNAPKNNRPFPFIGQLIELDIINAAAKGAVQFPLGFELQLVDGKGNKLDPKKLFFVKPGLKEIKAIVVLKRVEKPVESEPVRIDVKTITPEIIIEIVPGK